MFQVTRLWVRRHTSMNEAEFPPVRRLNVYMFVSDR